MKILRIMEPGRAEVADIPEPLPGPGEVRLRVRCVGYCGSDLSSWLGRNPLVKYPVIPGHELSGIVEETGEGVSDSIRKGMQATAVPYSSCGSCAACRRARPNACQNNETYGVQRDGVLAPVVVVPAEKIVPAEGLSPAAAALIEPLAVGCHAAKRGGADRGDVVVVFGCGAVGLGAMAAAASRGADKVVAVDIDDAKLDLARAVGATDAVNVVGNDLGSFLAKATGAAGPDLVVEASGAPAAYQAALEHASFAGRVACVSYAPAPVELNTAHFVKKELDVRGSRNADASDFADMAAVLGGDFPVDRVVTKSVPFEEAEAALVEWAARPAAVTKIQVVFPENA